MADESQPAIGPDDLVRFASDVEPLVQLIEITPRELCISTVAERLRNGTSYRELVAALYLAGIRNLTPSPGGALHAVFVIHSAHELGLDLSPRERILPMFWALDNFKATQEHNSAAEKLVNLQRIPPSPEKALNEFQEAMELFDADRAEAAIVALLQTHGSTRITEELWKYGARDYRAIGHKAIYVANSCRTLDTIGWRHAEPTLRHVVRALAAYGTDGRINGFNMDEQCHAANLVHAKEYVESLPSGWAARKDQPEVVTELIRAMRTADHKWACSTVVQHLRSGHATAGSVWDAVHLIAGEIVMRQTAIRPIHAITSMNALHYAFNRSSNSQTRLFIVLQAVGWMCHFIRYFESESASFPARPIEGLSPIDIPRSSDEAIAQIFESLTSDRDSAARQAFSLAQLEPPRDFMNAARAFVLAKGDESHRYKFPIAAFEDIRLLTPRWRPHFIAAATCYLCGSRMPDSKVMKIAREVLSSE